MTSTYDLSPDEPKPRIEAPSLLTPSGLEPCPRCGKPLAAEAVVCVNCGYDLKANVARGVEVGGAEEPEAALPEFVTAGRGDAQLMGVVGGVVLVAAAIVQMIERSGAGAGVAAAAAALAVLHAGLHTATGTLALAGTAWLTDHRLGRVDLGVARMFVLVSAFLLVLAVPLPWAPWAALAVKWIGGGAVYWAVAMVLFRKGAEPAGMLAGLHLLMMILVHVAIWVETTLGVIVQAAAQAAAAGAGGAVPPGAG